MDTCNFHTQDGFDLYATDFSDPIYNEYTDDGDPAPNAKIVCYSFNEYAYDEAQAKIDEANKGLKFYKLTLSDGYYAGTQIEIDDSETPDEWWMKHFFDFNEYGVNRYILRRMIEAERKRINNTILPAFKGIGFKHYGISARFSNGETWYSEIA